MTYLNLYVILAPVVTKDNAEYLYLLNEFGEKQFYFFLCSHNLLLFCVQS